jgi:ribulose 1,5-bisphosphate synthetase/thiazole synthase
MKQGNHVLEQAHRVPVATEVDVLVAGGGPAGIAAAFEAATQGARTMIVERYGYLGGMITGANVVVIIGVGDGNRPIARGFTQEVRERMSKCTPITPNRNGDYVVDREAFKWQAAEMLIEAGAEILLHSWISDPIVESDRIVGAYVETKIGRRAILASVVIDATADADLVFRAGGQCVDESHDVSLGITIEGVDATRAERFSAESPEECRRIMSAAAGLNGGVELGKTRYLKGVAVADPFSLTKAEIGLRNQYFTTLEYLKEHMPGYEAARIASTWDQIGVRQGRRIVGKHTFTEDDLTSSRHFDDGIARLGVYMKEYRDNYCIKGLNYDIPYRSLLPKSLEGVVTAGRCISCDYESCNSLRLLVPCFATGQAAGAAAALSADARVLPSQLDTSTLRKLLRQRDVYLG